MTVKYICTVCEFVSEIEKDLKEHEDQKHQKSLDNKMEIVLENEEDEKITEGECNKRNIIDSILN